MIRWASAPEPERVEAPLGYRRRYSRPINSRFCQLKGTGVVCPKFPAGVGCHTDRVTWHEDPSNAGLLERLRELIADQGRLLVFLGAGLSFGAARLNSRARFDYDHLQRRPWWPDGPRLIPDDDGLPLPSWPWLVSRMYEELGVTASENERHALLEFFSEEGPLDCAQLFRQSVGEANYREFLIRQFDAGRHDFIRATPSHQALVALQLRRLFTTNYDELIETAYQQAGERLRVSATEAQFTAHRRTDVAHLVKLHGSIDQPDTIVLTRSDYARARLERRAMLDHLRSELADAGFLFVGFSLSDPNFNTIHDDLRLVYGINMPASYTVQGRRNAVKERYLRSLDVNTIWLHGWNELPDFLGRINARSDAR